MGNFVRTYKKGSETLAQKTKEKGGEFMDFNQIVVDMGRRCNYNILAS